MRQASASAAQTRPRLSMGALVRGDSRAAVFDREDFMRISWAEAKAGS
jgi:hypothetical protein